MTTVVGFAVFVTARSTGGPGGGGCGVVGGVGGGGVGSGGVGPGVTGVLRVFVNVQTTTSPFATAPSTFVPAAATSSFPFRVHATLEYEAARSVARPSRSVDSASR